jgi:ATP-binding cassette, subfamily F, member 3
MIKISGLSFSYGAEPVFDSADFIVGENQKIGLVGPNGAGKSTLFSLITGKENPSAGKIEVLGEIGFVPQEVKRDPALEESNSIRDYIDPDGKKQKHELDKILSGLELDDIKLDQSPLKLSGGQKTKLALARALLLEPDVLLLDEPTNFMDKSGKSFVMNFLAKYPKTLILVSHDLDLLDKHIDKVLALNLQTKKIDEYKGNYSTYLKLKKEKESHLKRQILVKQKHIKKMEEALPKLYKLKSKKGVKVRVRQQKKIAREKENLPAMPLEIRKIRLNLPEPPRVGELPVQIVGISKSFSGKKVIDNLSFVIRRGEKFVLIGPNGSGKSTLIKILVGQAQPDTGHIVHGTNLKVGYYSQEFENIDLTETVLDVVTRRGQINEQRARGFLARFLFGHEKIKQRVETLSGGEKTRLSIALLMLENNNLLILDEPTTYLDPMSQRIILEAIKEYLGTIILVSHVEDFVKEISPDRALIMPEAKLMLWDNEILRKVGEI